MTSQKAIFAFHVLQSNCLFCHIAHFERYFPVYVYQAVAQQGYFY